MKRIALPLLLLSATGAAQAISVDPKAMARFDVGYAECEKRLPEMRGQRDEAWLALWRVGADDKTRAELAAVRKGSAYRAEQARLMKVGAASAAAAASAVDTQCQALRNETQRMLQTKSKP